MRASGGGEMAAGGEAHDADAVRIDLPFRGARADETNGPLGVLQRRRMNRRGTNFRGDAVLQDKCRHAEVVEELRDLLAFMVVGEEAVAASRTDDDRRAVGLVRRRG